MLSGFFPGLPPNWHRKHGLVVSLLDGNPEVSGSKPLVGDFTFGDPDVIQNVISFNLLLLVVHDQDFKPLPFVEGPEMPSIPFPLLLGWRCKASLCYDLQVEESVFPNLRGRYVKPVLSDYLPGLPTNWNRKDGLVVSLLAW